MNVSALREFTREESRKLTDMMMAFAHSPQCIGPMSSAISEIFGDIGSLTDDVRTAAESESCQSVFHTWFLFDRPIVKDGQTQRGIDCRTGASQAFLGGGESLRETAIQAHEAHVVMPRLAEYRSQFPPASIAQ